MTDDEAAAGVDHRAHKTIDCSADGRSKYSLPSVLDDHEVVRNFASAMRFVMSLRSSGATPGLFEVAVRCGGFI